MRINPNFEVVDISGEYLAIPIGDSSNEFNGVIALNEASAYLLKRLSAPKSLGDLVDSLTDEYSVDRETASQDILGFIERLKELNVIIDE